MLDLAITRIPAALIGSSVFDPASISGLRSRLLDDATFTSPIDSKYYLCDTSVENTHLPRQGRCWLFDGTNDSAVGAGHPLTGHSGDITFCAWIKLSSAGNFPMIISGSSGGLELRFNSTTRVLSFASGAGVVAAASSPNTTPLATWTHVAGTYEASTKTLRVYENGSLVASAAGTGTYPAIASTLTVGARGATFYFSGSMRDVRIFDSLVSDFTGVMAGDIAGSELAAYPCNEESGTTGYDISGNGNHLTLTNITQATFHAADTGVLANRNNAEGYRLSGSVYIPKRLSDSLAADGNALTVTGRAAYHGCAEVPCLTGDGSAVYASIPQQFPSTGDFSCSFWLYTGSSVGLKYPIAQFSGSVFGIYITGGTELYAYILDGATAAISISVNTWYFVQFSRVGDLYTIIANGGTRTRTKSGSLPTISTRILGRNDNALYHDGRIADFRLTSSGVTTYYPLQDGPGSSNTNRNLAYVKSDGTGGVISNAIVNGTVSTIWGNRVPGNVEDWCVKYGGRIATNGAFIAGMLSGGNAADGSAKTLTAGKFGNPFSRLNLNPATAAELNGRSVPTAAAAGADINATITPTDSAFRRTASDGDDRILIYDATLSGADLSNVEGYVA